MNKDSEKIKSRRNAGTSLRSHIQQVKSPEGTVSFHCNVCCKSFSRTQQYYHFGCVNEEAKKHKCPQCQKSFSSSSHLNYHLDSHHSTQVYRCDQCDRAFTNRAVLKKHQKLHGRATVVCEHCGKAFRCKTTLTAHVAAQHQRNLRFQCTQCEKKYAVKSTLQQHMQKHAAKQHECSRCGKRFQRNSTLKLHLRRHSKTECFVCTTCLRNFSDEGALLRHAKVHEASIIKYRCTLCDTSTARKDNMLRHVRNMHLGQNFEECVEVVPKISTQNEESSPHAFTSLISSSLINEEIVTHLDLNATEECFNLPKTVANSCVIKRIGNAAPIKVHMPNKTATSVPCMEPSAPTFTTLQNVRLNCTETAAVKQKKVKEKYNPIEMYKKILIADVEDEVEQEVQQENTNSADHIAEKALSCSIAIDKPPEQQPDNNSALNVSNFSETHWRKNFKYTYYTNKHS